MFPVMQMLRGLIVALLLLAWPALGQLSFSKPGRNNTQARLLLSHEAARPGDTVLAGVELKMAPGWHTYWRYPGDSGTETKIDWKLPAGWKAGEIQWPIPEKFVADDLITYVYHDRAVLLVPITVASNAAVGPQEISAEVKWLECEVACVPGSGSVEGKVTIGAETKPGADAAALKEAQARLPSKSVPGTASAKWDQPAEAARRALVIEWQTAAQGPEFFPYQNEFASISAKTDVLPGEAGKVLLRKIAEKSDKQWPKEIKGLLVRTEGGKPAGYEATLSLADVAPAKALPGSGGETKSIWKWLAYAFIGGLILNIMPCVLPVIALKILGFVAQSREHPRRVRTLGVLYTLGVIGSFLVLAGLVIGVQAAGRQAGWGMQFSNPQFIVILTVIVTLVALNLFGVFEVTVSGRALSAASEAASKHGSLGAFMNGVLATILATPCTAPFLGAALGFAFAQPAAIIVLFFVTIGLGLSLPYLVLSWNPKWLKVLPKPGLWMERFKVAMGFPMLATAVWLFTLANTHYGKRIVWLGVFLVLVALVAWIFGTFVQQGRARRGIAAAVAVILLLAGYAYAVERQLDWRSPMAEEQGDGIIRESRDGIAWRRWSPDAIAKARSQGPVFVDFTADWCLTCKLNKKTSIEVSSVRAKLKEIGATALLGDYTRLPPIITTELAKFGRAGVPLVLVYPKDTNKEPIVLPEVLTPNLVLNALDAAAK